MDMEKELNLDSDELVACINLVGRTGANNVEIGYLHDDVPMDQAGWYAHAQYQGVRIIAENQPGPVSAVKALALRLLKGGKCARCGGLIVLGGDGAYAYRRAVLADGTRWDAEDAAAAGQCRWERIGREWMMGCRKGGQA